MAADLYFSKPIYISITKGFLTSFAVSHLGYRGRILLERPGMEPELDPRKRGDHLSALTAPAEEDKKERRFGATMQAGWEERVDPSSGRKFYINHQTRE